MIMIVIVLLSSYLLGSIPTAYLVVKRLTGQDIRTIGSGNVGATNVKRAAGTKPFVFVLFMDFLKGVLPVRAGMVFFPHLYWLHVGIALMAILGHSRSIFLKFAGGKSAATSLGSMVALAPLGGLILAATAYLIIRISRFVSLGSITAAIISPFVMYALHSPIPYVIYVLMAAVYVIILHKANISRLFHGTENRI